MRKGNFSVIQDERTVQLPQMIVNNFGLVTNEILTWNFKEVFGWNVRHPFTFKKAALEINFGSQAAYPDLPGINLHLHVPLHTSTIKGAGTSLHPVAPTTTQIPKWLFDDLDMRAGDFLEWKTQESKILATLVKPEAKGRAFLAMFGF